MNLPGNPYPLRELAGAVWRMFGGAARPAPHALVPGVRTLELVPEAVGPMRWIGFVGDILPLMWRRGEISGGVRDFFGDCEWVLGNLEGIVTARRWFPFLQKHTEATFEALAQTAPAGRWRLSVANNHAGDYGEADFEATLREIERHGMRHFGSARAPGLELAPGIGVHAWSQWHNRRAPWVRERDPGPALIAYPHWGYEYERAPRRTQTVPPGYRVVVGHHPHYSQPIERLPDGGLVAWSLGNFVTEVRLASMGEGAILKVGLAADLRPARAMHAQIRLDRSDPRSCRVRILGE